MASIAKRAAVSSVAAILVGCDVGGPQPTIENTAGASGTASPGTVVCTEEADPLGTLMTADDLAAGLESTGAVVDESAGADSGFPPPAAFDENDGRRLIRQTWRSAGDIERGGLYGVDEFVWQFVTAEGAAAFFDAPAADLAGDADEDETLEPVGDNGRIFRDTSSGSLGTFDNYQFLFTAGNLAVKVAISGLQPLDPSAACHIAQAAEARATAFAEGPCT
ncbi:MAG: hypothetical protein ABR509_06325 [Candidatus Limnocylindria bacterium]